MISSPRYASYLLRFRQVRNDERIVWAASVQCIATGEQRPFADVEDLVEFLRAEFGGRGSFAGQEPDFGTRMNTD